jgi:4-hydroxy-3-polyprenylbenzoate decarboxylase
VAADFTLEMMRTGKQREILPGVARRLHWCGADATRLPFPDGSFDAVVSGFLLRNVVDIAASLAEQRRVLRPGGMLVALDTTPPPETPIAPLIRFHLHTVIPTLGGLLTGQQDAYTYLDRELPAARAPGVAPGGSRILRSGVCTQDVGYGRHLLGAAMSSRRLVVGISGASGAALGIRLLQALPELGFESHLVITAAGRLTIPKETDWQVAQVEALANVAYDPQDIEAAIASGSFSTYGMVVVPCSIKSLSGIANSYTGDLLTRAADVALKEGRPLALVVREAPLHLGHLELMARAARLGAIIYPPAPAFYTRPQNVDEIVDGIVGRVLQRIGLPNRMVQPWEG